MARGKESYTVALLLSFVLMALQPGSAWAGTVLIPGDTSIGTWDPATRTYTLTTDLSGAIRIDEDNLTLDGAGHLVSTRPGWHAVGVDLTARTDVTVKNLTVQGFGVRGISLSDCSGITLTGNTISNNYGGIFIHTSSASTLIGNTMSGNRWNFWLVGVSDSHYDNTIDTSNTVDGKPVYYVVNAVDQVYDSSTNAGVFYAINCDSIIIKDLALTNNVYDVFLWQTHNSRIENVSISAISGESGRGISLEYCSGNTVADNRISNKNTAISIQFGGGGHTVAGNTASNNFLGISLLHSSGNTLTGNTTSNNLYGVHLYNSSTNEIWNNNFMENVTQATVLGGWGNVFNVDKPIGGNYWSDWTGPDDDGDGFVDSPYVFPGGQDNLPWARQDGWLNAPPVAVALVNGQESVTVEEESWVGTTVTLDGSQSDDPDGDDLTYAWDFTSDGTVDSTDAVLAVTYGLGGPYTATLTVTDPFGETSTGTATITVVPGPPENQLGNVADLILDSVASGLIDPELEQPLVTKVGSAVDALARGNPNDAKVAMNDLKALINQVEAQVDKKIDAATAAEIIERANRIIADLAG